MLPRLFCAASLLALALGGCSLPAPYETYPPASPPPPPPRPANAMTVTGATTTTPENEMDIGAARSAPLAPAPSPSPSEAQSRATKTVPSPRVAICYNRLWNSAATIHSAAQEACGKRTTPRVVSQDIDLSACPVLTPTHAVYACDPAH